MKILDDEAVLNYLDKENDSQPPKFSTQQIQIHIDFFVRLQNNTGQTRKQPNAMRNTLQMG